MAETTISTSDNLAVKQWLDRSFLEYMDRLVLAKYMGTDTEGPSSLIHVNEELTKSKGDKVVFNLVGGLRGAGVRGDSVLEGSEEQLNTFDQSVTLEQYRNAILVGGKLASQRYPFEILDKAKPSLNQWMAQTAEDEAFIAMGSVDGVAYSAASTAQKDSWNVHNSDRILYGAAVANYNATHATALLNVDGTTDVLNTDQISLAKRLAKLCNPKIRPLRLGDSGGMELFVLFAHPLCTRDLKASTAWKDANREGMPRGLDNPLFTGALGMWDGVVIVETDKIAILANAGNGSTTDVAQNFLCGAQAVLMAQGGVGMARQEFVEKEFDYKNKSGVALASMFKFEKARFATGASGVSKDHGVLTVFSAAVAD